MMRLGQACLPNAGAGAAGLIAPPTPQLGGPRKKSRHSRHGLQIRAATSGLRIGDMSKQMKDMRKQMEEDAQLGSLMAGLRGQNIDDSDFADANVVMRLVEVDRDEQDALPQVYSPPAIRDYWGRRPVAVVTRVAQLLNISWGFLSKLGVDALRGRLQQNEVARAIELRNIVTSLGPAYIKLGQALSIRPDLLSPAAMVELQKLCDKVPSFDDKVAMAVVQQEFGKPWQEVFASLSPSPIAAASLGQVYRGTLRSGEDVAVKVQRPFVLETVTVDLFILRSVAVFLQRFNIPTDFTALLDEWATRFFEELDYVHEGQNGTRFAEMMRSDLPQVVVPPTFEAYTTRRVLTTGWLEGEKLSQSKEGDVAQLVNLGVVAYLKQLLDTGFFHADPHPGNLMRTPDGRLAILDFGLMSTVGDNIKYGMIEAISHLIHRDYAAIAQDFVTLDFIEAGTDLSPILPVLAKVFDQALEGGGAKNINFQELAADLAQITFDYPFRIPPYFALIIRAISVLEGIALVGDPDFALVDEAYPYIAKRLLTDKSPRLQAALRYMIYGKENVFDAERLIDLLGAFETFREASQSARGNMDGDSDAFVLPTNDNTQGRSATSSTSSTGASTSGREQQTPQTSTSQSSGFGFPQLFPTPTLFPVPAFGLFSLPELLISPLTGFLGGPGAGGTGALQLPAASSSASGGVAKYTPGQATQGGSGTGRAAREALKFVLSKEGAFFREFLMTEIVVSIDGMSRKQLAMLAERLGLQSAMIPIVLPGVGRTMYPLAPEVSAKDEKAVQNVAKIADFLLGGQAQRFAGSADPMEGLRLAQELAPFLPAVASEILPEVIARLVSRVSARALRLAVEE
ncbi:hypothetical protein WJX73_009983 [Symbiochloris irregularis]|uniref:Protein kinase domain-containing protein n=1 Tax=Symbiochloris irregularis TaxID=706552 RepID=A0AAW1NK51_9CHLO